MNVSQSWHYGLRRLLAVFSVIFSLVFGQAKGAWTGSDIGSVGVTGTDSYNVGTGVYTIAGSGSDIAGTADAFHYVYQSLTADGELTARVASIQNTNALAKAGVMIRQTTAAGAVNALLAVTPTTGVNFLQRTTLGGTTSALTQTSTSTAPYWIKIIKDGTLVTVFQSPDGVTWTYAAETRLSSLTNPVDIGFAVCSHSNSVLCTATFDNITLNSQTSFAPSLPWHDQDIGTPGQAGQVHVEAALWSLYGGGAGITGTGDNFHFGYQALSGNGVAIAQVNGLSSSTASAGVIMRQDLTAGSVEAGVLLNSTSGVSFATRATSGATLASVAGAHVTAPYWVKLVRAGSVFSGYQSTDGSTWTLVSSQTISMTGTIYVGVGSTSGNNSTLAMAVLDRVYVIPFGSYLSTGTIASGANHNLYLQSNGSIWAWGLNTNGQVGDATTTTRASPVHLTTLSAMEAVSGGASHSLALKNDGTVWVWGLNTNGQLGDGTTTQHTSPEQLTTLSGIMAISAGASHSIALKNDGTVWVWGLNTNGQLGDGTTTQHTSPEQLTTLSGIVGISAGGNYSLALKSDGTVWAWGNNATGQLGDGTTTQHTSPEKLTSLSNAIGISAGTSHSLMVDDNGVVWAWGDNSSGEIGDGTTTQRATPVQLTSLSGMLAVQASNLFSLGLKNDGTVWTWGKNTSGQLGNNTTTQENSPVQATGLTGAVAISAGTSHAAAVTSDSAIWTWGANASGQLGNGTTTASLVPHSIKPSITSLLTATGTTGIAFTYTITASCVPTSYNATGLPSGLSINTTTGVISGTPLSVGTSLVAISATNVSGTGSATLTITVNPPAPVISSAATAAGNVSSPFTYAITASNSPTSYGATGLPSTLTVNTSSGVISGTPTVTGTYTVTLSATNAGGTGTKTLTLTVKVAIPVITSATSASGTNGVAFTYTITASNTPTSYGATGLPTGLSVNSTTGKITGTPGAVGTSSVTISATNAGGTGSATLSLTINPPVPVITSAGTATGTNGTAFSYTITATNSPTSFGASGLPSGLSVNSSSGLISGTPGVTGVFTVVLTASNAGGPGTKNLTLTINPAHPVITSSSTASGATGTAFTYTITASNSPTSFNATGLPTGLSVNTTTGAITGTPNIAGTFNVTLSATNSGGTGTATLTLTVSLSAPVITSATTVTGITGTNWNYLITASSTPTSFTATGLPAGLSVNASTGMIVGAPLVSGTFTVSLGATNATGTGSATMTLVVNSAPPVLPVMSGLSAWYEADAGVTNSANGVTQWTDQSANQAPVTQTDTSSTPGLAQDTSSGKPMLTLNGNQFLTSSAQIPNLDDVTIITVSGATAPTSGFQTQVVVGALFDDNGARMLVNDSGNIGFDNSSTTVDGGAVPNNSLLNISTVTFSESGGLATFFSQGIANGSAPITATSLASGLTIGSVSNTPYQCWTGNMAEVIVYNRVLTTTERQQVETYLANKYNIYAPGAAWIGNFSSSVQSLINANHWTQSQAIQNLQTTYPVITSAGTASDLAGTAFSYNVTASNSPTYFEASGLPSGLTINATTGVISGTPMTSGTYGATISAINASGTGQATLTITVQPSIPVVSSPTTGGGTVGTPFSYSTVAGSNTTAYAASGLPGGLSINTSTGVISGTPLTAGTSTVTLSATNINGTGHATLTLTIFAPLPVTTGLAAWYNAGAGVVSSGRNVTQWNDQSPNLLNIAESTSGWTPGFGQDPTTGLPVLTFNGNQLLTTATQITGLDDVTIITVASSNAPTNGVQTQVTVGALFDDQGARIFTYNGGYQAFATPDNQVEGGAVQANSQLSINTMTFSESGGIANFYSQGVANGSGAITATSLAAGLTVGSVSNTPYQGWNGNIAEVIVFDRVLTSTERQQVEGYLATKYGLYVSGASWISSYTTAVQAEINRNQWTKSQADAYVAFQAANPSMLTNGLRMWLKADAGVTTGIGSYVTGWADQTGTFPLSQTERLGQPTLVTNDSNGEPALRFSGSQSLTNPSSVGGGANADMTVITVGMTTAPSSTEYSLYLGNEITGGTRGLGYNNLSQYFDTTGSTAVGTTAPGNNLFTAEAASLNSALTGVTFYRNGIQTGTGTVSGLGATNAGISVGNAWQGDISEVLVYDHQLNSTELQQVSLYLANKYGLYYAGATWISSYTTAVQTQINANQWNKAQADAYVQTSLTLPVATGLTAWFKADSGVQTSGSTQVTGWADSSGNHNDVSQAISADQPISTFDPGTGKPTIQFNGSTQFLGNNNNLSSVNDVTIITVASTPTPLASSRSTLVGIGLGYNGLTERALVYDYGKQGFSNGTSGTTINFYDGLSVPSTTALTNTAVTYSHSTSIASFYTNGAANGTATGISVSPVTTGLAIGSIQNIVNNVCWNGNISEVLIYNRVLTPTELSSIQTYLAAKYTPFSISAPTISPNGGNITTSTSISLSGATSPAVIRYTVDGTTPTSASTQYTSTFNLSQDGQTVKCAVFNGTTQLSPMASAQFWIGDTNHIGIPDAWQITYFGAIGISPSAQSPGGSGLTNLQAYEYGYNPTLYSTNGDGLSDLVNYQLGYAATNTDINGYTNASGNPMTNAQQLALGLDPFDVGVNPAQPTPPTPNPLDHTAPVITLTQPANATLLP